MHYCADLHIHSPYSRGTSKNLSLVELKKWALVKGINVLGTGDFTHPQWRSILKEKLIPDGRGFFVLDEEQSAAARDGPKVADIPFRFCLSAEISSIYKKNGATRKVHSVIFAPGMEAAERISTRLAAIGNVNSDGRPILGLDPKHLLEIILEVSTDCHLIPAHIWTPWFSVFGAHSGFDSLQECFEDLLPHIFALETGLSSDPIMNWRVSALDRFTLVSNSDAHSAQKLMREANLFDTELSYGALFDALKTRQGFAGTIEFFPQEGKYHHDGHRKCGVALAPEETIRLSGICPVCHKPLTVGVMHRVLDLADRSEGIAPPTHKGFRYAIPLVEIISEILECGTGSKAVSACYDKAVEAAGNERLFLFDIPIEEIRKKTDDFLALAVKRLREGKIFAQPGYDGEFGRIRVFAPGELERLRGQQELFTVPTSLSKRSLSSPELFERAAETAPRPPEETFGKDELDSEQKKVLALTKGAVMVLAGPGTGKTRTLTHWLTKLIRQGVDPRAVLAVTFTHKAREELASRLLAQLGEQARGVTVSTFHSLCFEIISTWYPEAKSIYDEAGRRSLLRFLYPALTVKETDELCRGLEGYLDGTLVAPDAELDRIAGEYQEALKTVGGVDVAALVSSVNLIFSSRSEILDLYRRRFRVIAVDEFQDINATQYRLLSLLIGPTAGQEGKREVKKKSVCVIGDPDQAIYRFRGADPSLMFRFQNDYQAVFASLAANHRSSGAIIEAARGLISHNSLKSGLALKPVRPFGAKVSVAGFHDENEEAHYIAGLIASLVGGVDLISPFELAHPGSQPYSFRDIAVLARTHRALESVMRACVRHTIPVAVRNQRLLLAEPRFALLVEMFRHLLNKQDIVAFKNITAHFIPRLSREGFAAVMLALKNCGTEPSRITDDPGVKETLAGEELAALENLFRFLEFVETETEAQGVGKGILLLLENLRGQKEPTEEEKLSEAALIEMAHGFGNDMTRFVREALLSVREVSFGFPVERVSFLTFHAAKGLEFPVVCIAAAEEGIAPQTKVDSDPEEERRLFYVAMTRAEQRLFITHAEKRELFGKETAQTPSRFLSEIPPETVHATVTPRKKTVYTQPGLF